jgi:hypothetical protein
MKPEKNLHDLPKEELIEELERFACRKTTRQ